MIETITLEIWKYHQEKNQDCNVQVWANRTIKETLRLVPTYQQMVQIGRSAQVEENKEKRNCPTTPKRCNL